VCSIPEEALVLPEPVIITPMKVHQRYIPLRTAEGGLSRNFLAVANGPYDAGAREIIREGNERVLNARLRDARYFWDTDTRHDLGHFAQGLDRLLFHQELGTVADKVARLHVLAPALAPDLPETDSAMLAQTLDLMKADLTTQMVGEFSSLEGIVGMLYARKEGLAEPVAKALFEHRLPRRAGDALPSEPLGVAAGLLDRLDTLAGYFGIGVRVKGTSDPYGLRRSALAVLAVLRNQRIDLDLGDALSAAARGFGGLVKNPEEAVATALAFFGDRLSVMAREEGFRHDLVAAALARHAARPARFFACLDALSALDDATVQGIAEQAKRIERIAKEPADAVRADLLEASEQALHDLLGEPAARMRAAVDSGRFDQALAEAAAWVPIVSAYFEQVLVNAEDRALRGNRHALLREAMACLCAAADFTLIEKKDVS
jgi:glycyl-tRNA synthetase beta chain